QEIFRIIRDFKREKRTVLLVEQNAKKALQCADRGYVLETGSVVLTGSGYDLLKSEAVQAAYLRAPAGRARGRRRGERRAASAAPCLTSAEGIGYDGAQCALRAGPPRERRGDDRGSAGDRHARRQPCRDGRRDLGHAAHRGRLRPRLAEPPPRPPRVRGDLP